MLHIIEEFVLNNNVFLFIEYNSRKLLNEIMANRMHIGNSFRASRSAGGEKHER